MNRPARVARTIDGVREELTASLCSPELQDVGACIRWSEAGPVEAVLDSHLAAAADGSPLAQLFATHPEYAAHEARPVERFLLTHAALTALERVALLPVVDAVRQQWFEEVCLYATPDPRRRPLLQWETATFRAACELVRLRRFPAGQYHWDVSGFSRRYLRHVAPRDLPRFLAFLAVRMRGLGPAFFPHVNGFRRNPFVWLETESNRSLYRMAMCLERQPAIIGLVTRAWLHDPQLADTSPHLAWVNRVFRENGGLVVANGAADTDAGFLANNAARQKSFEEGSYRPQYGVVLWPRRAMLNWAARHPEFAD